MILKRKLDEQWHIDCYKVGLIAKDYGQKDENEHKKTLAPASFKRMGNTMILLQSAYCRPILKEFGKVKAKTASSSMVENLKKFFWNLCRVRRSTREGKMVPKGPQLGICCV